MNLDDFDIDFVLGTPLPFIFSWCFSSFFAAWKIEQAYEKLIHDVIQGVSWIQKERVEIDSWAFGCYALMCFGVYFKDS